MQPVRSALIPLSTASDIDLVMNAISSHRYQSRIKPLSARATDAHTWAQAVQSAALQGRIRKAKEKDKKVSDYPAQMV